MQPLSQDWQDFYQQLGVGAATFGLFDLPVVGVQPVLLIHAAPNTQIGQQAMLRSTLELYKPEGVYVVRMLIEIQAEDFPPPRDYEELTVFIHDQPRRSTRELTVIIEPTPSRFETFLNPTDVEDHTILQKLEQGKALYVLLVRSGQMLWGKQFPWQESLRAAIREILEETKDASPVDVQTWQHVKELVMEKSSL